MEIRVYVPAYIIHTIVVVPFGLLPVKAFCVTRPRKAVLAELIKLDFPAPSWPRNKMLACKKM